MTFFDPLYRALAYIGYRDPLHAPFTHFPIALVTAALIFALAASWFKRSNFWTFAGYSLVLAWLFTFPTVLTGFMDWQHYYRGEWMFLIELKIYLTSFLFVILSIGLILVYKGRGESPAILGVYVIAFITVVALGFFGGRIVYGGLGGPGASKQVEAGEKIFQHHCRSCHEGGGDIVMHQYPVKGSEYLADFNKFVDFIRDPRLPDGSKGPMPAFPHNKITDREAHELYQFLVQKFGKVCEGGTSR
jgi:uncharacterized membrane protein